MLSLHGLLLRITALAAVACCGLALAATATGVEPGAATGRTDRVSMDVWKQPLREVAEQLARRAAVDILIPADVANLVVSASLVDVDVRAALQRLLAHRSYMLIERKAGAGHQDRPIIEVLLLDTASPRTAAAQAAPIRIAADEDRSVDELVQAALSAAPATERAAAVDAIAYRDPQAGGAEARAEPVLLSALIDPAEEVRAQAIATLKDTSDRIPFDALSQVAREDSSADLRIQALELIVERSENGEAREPLGIAFNDPEPAVRERAHELAEDWQVVPIR
jgi:hypothetical protein